MITFKELLKGTPLSEIPINHQQNGEILLKKINIVRAEYGKPMIPTSVYRTKQRQLDIYRAKGIPDSKIPMSSQHLSFEAVDISDPKGELYKWLQDNPEVLEKADMYVELGTVGWTHLQCRPFASYRPGGSRWFNP